MLWVAIFDGVFFDWFCCWLFFLVGGGSGGKEIFLSCSALAVLGVLFLFVVGIVVVSCFFVCSGFLFPFLLWSHCLMSYHFRLRLCFLYFVFFVLC